MKAKLWARTKEVRDDGSMVEVAIWELPEAVPPSTHSFKYRLFYGVDGAWRVRDDNERGKGDHRHLADKKVDSVLVSIDQLLDDFARLALLDTLRQSGPSSVYALAKAAERNYSNVYTDVARLEALGLTERGNDSTVSVPFDAVEIRLPLAQAG